MNPISTTHQILNFKIYDQINVIINQVRIDDLYKLSYN